MSRCVSRCVVCTEQGRVISSPCACLLVHACLCTLEGPRLFVKHFAHAYGVILDRANGMVRAAFALPCPELAPRFFQKMDLACLVSLHLPLPVSGPSPLVGEYPPFRSTSFINGLAGVHVRRLASSAATAATTACCSDCTASVSSSRSCS